MRRIVNINDGWMFYYRDNDPILVNVPHTWNNLDGQDGGNDYYRGKCIYQKTLIKPDYKNEERIYLQFHGVNSSCNVFINDNKVTSHDGGYSTFRVDITDYLNDEDIIIKVEVDNSINDRVYPQRADFTFYGGIYRDVELLIVSKEHFSLDYYGGSGIQYDAKVENEDAYVFVKTYTNVEEDVLVQLFDAQGNLIDEKIGKDVSLKIENVHLWDGINDPYLYRLKASLIVDSLIKDEVSCYVGVRTFKFDSKKGFYLNGKPYPLHGVSRHQDRKLLGNAITYKHMDEDMKIIKEMGTNSIRLAHYQHNQYFYDLCDREGMIVWAEIPYISEHLSNGNENTISQMKELIIQNYNHPSIVMWGISNEITIKDNHRKDMLKNHHKLQDLCKKLDSNRTTTLANYAMCTPFHPVTKITDIVAWNLYLGWYVPGLFLNDLFMWFYHFIYPNRCLGYSEYGAEGMPNLHTKTPHIGDHSEEYQSKYHEYMLKCFKRHQFMWGTYVWNMFDFAADARNQGGEPGMNHKGLVTFDRKTKKDSFYLYKAYWSEEPFIHIASKRYEYREGKYTTIRVYTNQKEVSLYVNDELKKVKKGEQVYTFKIKMNEVNKIKVVSNSLVDETIIYSCKKKKKEYILKKGKSQNWV
ncbi:MAG: glycoside hydrolase family 2 protein [Erysipelotrichaceae bacterium]|nr:glycoside hydrolase family 2 protein [Erysipelotrichaceae bacterium]